MESGTNYHIYKALNKARERINKMILRVYCEEQCYNHHSIFQLLKSRTITVDKPMNIIFIIDISSENKSLQNLYQLYLLFHRLLSKIKYPSQLQVYLISDSIISHHILNFNQISLPEELPPFQPVELQFNNESLLDCFEHLISQQFQFGNRILFIDTPTKSNDETLENYVEELYNRFFSINFLKNEKEKELFHYDTIYYSNEMMEYLFSRSLNFPFALKKRATLTQIKLPFVSYHPYLLPPEIVTENVQIEREGNIFNVTQTKHVPLKMTKLTEMNTIEMIDCYEAQRIVEEFIPIFNTQCREVGMNQVQLHYAKPVCVCDDYQSPFSRCLLLTPQMKHEDITNLFFIEAFCHFVYEYSEKTLYISRVIGKNGDKCTISFVKMFSISSSKFGYWPLKKEEIIQHKCGYFCRVLKISQSNPNDFEKYLQNGRNQKVMN